MTNKTWPCFPGTFYTATLSVYATVHVYTRPLQGTRNARQCLAGHLVRRYVGEVTDDPYADPNNPPKDPRFNPCTVTIFQEIINLFGMEAIMP